MYNNSYSTSFEIIRQIIKYTGYTCVEKVNTAVYYVFEDVIKSTQPSQNYSCEVNLNGESII